MSVNFKNPETGEIMGLDEAFEKFCNSQDCCEGCPFGSVPGSWSDCKSWAWKNIEKAAEVMKLEVVEEEEKTLVETQDPETGDLCYSVKKEKSMKSNTAKSTVKPKICEILGVEVGEEFKIKGWDKVVFQILDNGTFTTQPINVPGSSMALLQTLDHPEWVEYVLHWNLEEVALAKAFLNACYGMEDVYFARKADGRLYWGVDSEDEGKDSDDTFLPVNLFPQIKNYQRVYLRDIVG